MATWLVPGRALPTGPQPLPCAGLPPTSQARSWTSAEDTCGHQLLCALGTDLPWDRGLPGSEPGSSCCAWSPMVIQEKNTLDFWLLSLSFWGCHQNVALHSTASPPGAPIWFTLGWHYCVPGSEGVLAQGLGC